MRRVFLRGHINIRKRLLIHVAGFNLGLLLRQLIGVGTPRALQGRLAEAMCALLTFLRALPSLVTSPVYRTTRFALRACLDRAA